MAINQKSFWDALRPVALIGVNEASQSNVKYRNYLKSALMGAQVERPSGTYTGHYHTGALHRSIKDSFAVKSLSSRRIKVSVGSNMLPYGYELSDGYQAKPVTWQKLGQWVEYRTGEPSNGTIARRIFQALMKRPFRKGSGWIEDANEDFFPAYENKIHESVVSIMGIPAEAYVDNALRSIFRGKNEKVFNRGAQL